MDPTNKYHLELHFQWIHEVGSRSVTNKYIYKLITMLAWFQFFLQACSLLIGYNKNKTWLLKKKYCRLYKYKTISEIMIKKLKKAGLTLAISMSQIIGKLT